MQVKRHYAILATKRLEKFLDTYGITYETCALPETNDMLCSFDLIEGHDVCNAFLKAFPFMFHNTVSKSVEYSEMEIGNAEWLYIRCKSKGVKWTYKEDAFNLSCSYKKPFQNSKIYRHIEQVHPLTVVKNMSWNKNRFFSGPDTADDFIFCSSKAKDKLDHTWDGLTFMPVWNRNREIHMDLYQMSFEQQLPSEALSGGVRVKCPSCGRTCIKIRDYVTDLRIRERFLPNKNSVYTTGEVLTSHFANCTTYSLNIVPHSFYQYCKENYMNHGLIYEPVVVVSE